MTRHAGYFPHPREASLTSAGVQRTTFSGKYVFYVAILDRFGCVEIVLNGQKLRAAFRSNLVRRGY